MRHASNHQNLSLPTNSQQRPKSGHRHDSHNAKPIQREEELPAPQKGSRTEFEDRIRRALSPSHSHSPSLPASWPLKSDSDLQQSKPSPSLPPLLWELTRVHYWWHRRGRDWRPNQARSAYHWWPSPPHSSPTSWWIPPSHLTLSTNQSINPPSRTSPPLVHQNLKTLVQKPPATNNNNKQQHATKQRRVL